MDIVNPVIVPPEPTVDVAAAPALVGVPIATTGDIGYPDPGSEMVNLTIPNSVVSTEHVAIASVPPPPTMDIVGASVYPNPAFVNKISFTDLIVPDVVVMAIASALAKGSPFGEVEMETVGVDVYPYPSSFKNISLTYPVAVCAIVCAVVPDPIITIEVMYP